MSENKFRSVEVSADSAVVFCNGNKLSVEEVVDMLNKYDHKIKSLEEHNCRLVSMLLDQNNLLQYASIEEILRIRGKFEEYAEKKGWTI